MGSLRTSAPENRKWVRLAISFQQTHLNWRPGVNEN